MKTGWLLAAVGITALGLWVLSSPRSEGPGPEVEAPPTPGAAAAPDPDPIVAEAHRQAAAHPTAPAPWWQLTRHFLTRARHTGDFSYNDRAHFALKEATARSPGDPQSQLLHARILFVYHSFDGAKGAAEQARAALPGDPSAADVLFDALMELGEYDRATQVLSERLSTRVDVDGALRLAQLRELRGDLEGAAHAWEVAAGALKGGDAEALAWLCAQWADTTLQRGDVEGARSILNRGEAAWPGHPWLHLSRARLQLWTGEAAAAAASLQASMKALPLVETASWLVDVYAHLGQPGEAAKARALMDALDVAAGGGPTRPSLALARAWLGRGEHTEEALARAQAEYATRRDVFTCDTLAHALTRASRPAEALPALTCALATGTRDARVHAHAAQLYHTLGDPAGARRSADIARQDRAWALLYGALLPGGQGG